MILNWRPIFLTLFTPPMSLKRCRKTGVKEELRLSADKTTLRSHEVLVNSHCQFISNPISPKKKKVTRWTNITSWEPEDRSDFALDPSSEWYDEAVHGDVYDSHGWEDISTSGRTGAIEDDGGKETVGIGPNDTQTADKVMKAKRTLRSVGSKPYLKRTRCKKY